MKFPALADHRDELSVPSSWGALYLSFGRDAERV
jgi:hypothetical protein